LTADDMDDIVYIIAMTTLTGCATASTRSACWVI